MTAPVDRVLSYDALRDLQGRSDAQGAARLAIHTAALIAAGGWVATATGWLTLPAVFVLGLVQVHYLLRRMRPCIRPHSPPAAPTRWSVG